MSAIYNGTYPKRDLRSMLVDRGFISEETEVFCKQDNLERSLHILNEEFESFGVPSLTIDSDMQSTESLRKLSVQVVNATWKLIHKHRYLMRLHDQLIELNQKTVNDNVNLKVSLLVLKIRINIEILCIISCCTVKCLNHVKRLKENLEKKEHTICKAEERERQLNVKFEDASRGLKQEKEEIRKLKKQAQFKDVQHEHEIRRLTQNSQKLQEQLQKSAGSFTPKDKLLQKTHEKELTAYKQTICRLEENNRCMLEEINNLKETLELHQTGIDLHIEASGAWTNADT